MTLSHPLGVSIPRAPDLRASAALRSGATTPHPRPHELKITASQAWPKATEERNHHDMSRRSLRTSWSIGLNALAWEGAVKAN